MSVKMQLLSRVAFPLKYLTTVSVITTVQRLFLYIKSTCVWEVCELLHESLFCVLTDFFSCILLTRMKLNRRDRYIVLFLFHDPVKVRTKCPLLKCFNNYAVKCQISHSIIYSKTMSQQPINSVSCFDNNKAVE